MPVDYGRLVDGLRAAAERINTGRAGLAGVGALVAALQDATGAVGATFTEYAAGSGRVVVARGDLAWALGQPIAAEFIDEEQRSRPWSTRVERLPPPIAEPLLARGIVGIAGHPVRAGRRTVGAIHLYFGGVEETSWEHAHAALQVGAALAASAYGDPDNQPTTAVLDDDDRNLFLAVAGHELRTPVTVVKGYAGMLADRWDVMDDASRREAARVLRQRADELARLVDRLLGASVGDGTVGRLLRTVPFDLIEALTRAVGEFPPERRRVVRVELPNSLPPASGDPTVLASILAELITNAVRSMEGASPPTASVELQAGADAHTVYFRVLDRGTGIDPTDVERAFERFWQGRRTGDGRSGVGLGLYLVRRIVERQNGWVSLRAREGGGTIAEVRLPRADVAQLTVGALRLANPTAKTIGSPPEGSPAVSEESDGPPGPKEP